MLLTAEQRHAVSRDDRSTFVEACPGSGKTRTIVAKLLRCVDQLRDSPRRIACITYTNAAVHEIETRLREYGSRDDDEYFSVSTIHAFCMTHVLRHFHWRLPEYAYGFSVAAPETDEYERALQATCDAHHVTVTAKVREDFELLDRATDGTPIVTGNTALSAEMAAEFWNRLAASRLMDFPSVLYLTYQLLSERPRIAEAIACRFAWILIDEFQDTSALQIALLRLIAARQRTLFFLVGDPCQSIFGFAGARPDLADAFATDLNAHRDATLSANYRSSRHVIAHAESLSPRVPAMQAVGTHAESPLLPRYLHAATALEAITDHFIPALEAAHIPLGHAAILSPWWIKLLHLGRGLREFGIPIIGPGARPYKRDRLFSRLAEHTCAYIERRNAMMVRRIERALFELVLQVTGAPRYDIFGYSGRVTIYKMVRVGTELRDESPAGTVWLERAAAQFDTILLQNKLLPPSASGLLAASVADMRGDMERNGVDIANLSVADLGLFAAPDTSLSLLTMHKAKGREFAGVAIIDLHDGRVPDYRAQTQDQINEGRRLLYVAITRAEQLLMYVTDGEDNRNRPSRFLGPTGMQLAVERV